MQGTKLNEKKRTLENEFNLSSERRRSAHVECEENTIYKQGYHSYGKNR